jgi:hypothetical protein
VVRLIQISAGAAEECSSQGSGVEGEVLRNSIKLFREEGGERWDDEMPQGVLDRKGYDIDTRAGVCVSQHGLISQHKFLKTSSNKARVL